MTETPQLGIVDDQSRVNEVLQSVTLAIVAEKLSYRDVLGDDAPIAEGESAAKYGAALAEYELSGRGEEVLVAAQDVRSRFERKRNVLPAGVVLSKFADSESWIFWDIGKQEALKDEPYVNGYFSGSAIETATGHDERDVDFMREAIAARHFGWEVHQMALRGEDMSWLESILHLKTGSHGEEFAARQRGEGHTINNRYHQTIWEQLHKVGDADHNGQLPSSEYVDLGIALEHVLSGYDYFDQQSLVKVHPAQ